MPGEVIVASTAGDGADVFVLGKDEFKDGAGVIVETADDFHVGGNLVFQTSGF